MTPSIDLQRMRAFEFFSVIRAMRSTAYALPIDPLLARLDDEDGSVRYSAAQALGEIGDARAVESLLARLEDEDWIMRYLAARALGQLGDAWAVEPLLARLEDRQDCSSRQPTRRGARQDVRGL